MLIYSRPITVAYHANRASCASCWSTCYLLLLIVLPYVLAIAMGAFWTKDAFEREQPGVRFRHEVLVEAYLADGTAIGWSTSDQLNTALGERLRPCQLRAWPEDTDRDGKPEALQFSLKVPLDADGGERLHGLTVLVGVEAVYASNRFADLRLNGSVLVQHQSGLPGAGLGRTSCPRNDAMVSLCGECGERSMPTWPGCRARDGQRRDCGTPLLARLSTSLQLLPPRCAVAAARRSRPAHDQPVATGVNGVAQAVHLPLLAAAATARTRRPADHCRGRGGPVCRVQRHAHSRGAASPVDSWRRLLLRAPPHAPRAERAHPLPAGRARSAQARLDPIPRAAAAHLLAARLGARLTLTPT